MTVTDLGQRVKIDMADFHETVELLARINDEVQAQELKWGQQDHPIVQGPLPRLSRQTYARKADTAKAVNDARHANGTLIWDAILLEEVYEALAEADDERAITELVQVAAVALSMAKSIARNGVAGAPRE